MAHDFYNEFENPCVLHIRIFRMTVLLMRYFARRFALGVQRQRPIYERAVKSFASTIKPNARIRSFIDKARSELLPSPPSSADSSESPTSYIAVHMRNGDSKPQSSRYGQQPIPATDYAVGISKAISDLQLSATNESSRITVFVASDSVRAVEELESWQPEPSVGKTAWRVISLRSSAYPELRELVYPRLDGYQQKDWRGSRASELGLHWTDEERVRYTTGMIVDLALLSGLWPSTSSSIGAESESEITSAIPSAAICGVKCVCYQDQHSIAAVMAKYHSTGQQFVQPWRSALGSTAHLLATVV